MLVLLMISCLPFYFSFEIIMCKVRYFSDIYDILQRKKSKLTALSLILFEISEKTTDNIAETKKKSRYLRLLFLFCHGKDYSAIDSRRC